MIQTNARSNGRRNVMESVLWRPMMPLVLLLAAVLTPTAVNAATVSTFDADKEGWTGNTSAFEFTWATSGGNPDGYLRFVDGVQGPSFIIGPSAFLGDWATQFEGGSLQYDHKIFFVGPLGTFNPNTVNISGPGGAAVFTGPDFADAGWVTNTVPILEASWSVTSGTWAGLMSNVTDLRIQIEAVANAGGVADIDGIDNVRLTPEPATLFLVGLSALILVRRRR